jgi:hypothetical protein
MDPYATFVRRCCFGAVGFFTTCPSSAIIRSAARVINPDRVNPCNSANLSIALKACSGIVTFTRTALAASAGAATRMATPFLFSASDMIASSEEGSGIASPSSSSPSRCNASASAAILRASSRVVPAVTHPGNDNPNRPKSDPKPRIHRTPSTVFSIRSHAGSEPRRQRRHWRRWSARRRRQDESDQNEIVSVPKAPRPAYLNALIAAPPAKRACGPSSSSIRMS